MMFHAHVGKVPPTPFVEAACGEEVPRARIAGYVSRRRWFRLPSNPYAIRVTCDTCAGHVRRLTEIPRNPRPQ